MGHTLGHSWDIIRRRIQSGARSFTLHPMRDKMRTRAVTPGYSTEFGTTMREGVSLTSLNPFAHKRLRKELQQEKNFCFLPPAWRRPLQTPQSRSCHKRQVYVSLTQSPLSAQAVLPSPLQNSRHSTRCSGLTSQRKTTSCAQS